MHEPPAQPGQQWPLAPHQPPPPPPYGPPQQQYPPQPPPQWGPPAQYGPPPWGQPQPYAPQPVMPSRAVSRQKLNPFETMFHMFATLCTCGLWGFVWWARVRSRKTVTRFG